VAAVAVGDVALDGLRAALGAHDLSIGEPARLLVVATDDYLREGLREINREALAAGRSWLLAKPVGALLWLGPLFHPGRTACWVCLAQRLRANRAVDGYLRGRTARSEPVPVSRAASPATVQLGCALAARDAARWIDEGVFSGGEGALVTVDVRTWETRRHVVVRRPQCPACGDPAAGSRPMAPLALERRRKLFTSDGGHRSVGPEATLVRHGHHVSPITGAVTMLQPMDVGAGGLIHVYRSHHGGVVEQGCLNGLRGELRGGCAGKGASEPQARASALCEALECYSSSFTGDEPRRQARLRELGGAAIHPNACLLFSDRQYRERDRWNGLESYFCLVPRPLDPEGRLDWTAVWSLTRQEVRYLPTNLCYFGYPGADELPLSSSGHAAGNTLEEAVLQGLLELIERDACAIWWYNRVARPRLDLASFDLPYVNRVSAFLAGRGRSLWVLDLTGDLGIPVFAAVSRRVEGGGPEHVLLGFGAHLDPAIALLRAVAELTQMLTWVWRGEGGERFDPAEMSPITARWLATATLESEPYLAPLPGTPRARGSFPRHFSDDLRDDIDHCRARVEQRGMEVLVLDLTRPDVGLPTVKVIVPGLRPLWARLAPGRLYQVPVQLGWIPRALSESQLNPVPMFL
jgi:bacteriocin biosynthesis cyclodehydratase domain-containing protein